MSEISHEAIGESQLPTWPPEIFYDVEGIPELEVPETLDPNQALKQNILDATYTLAGDNGGIIRDRFGMTGEEPKTIQDLAELYQKEQTRVLDIIVFGRRSINTALDIRSQDWPF